MRSALELLLLAAVASAAEPALAVRIVDGATGEPIEDARCVLADPAAQRVRERLAAPRYEGDVAPKAGDALFVHARGYDLARVDVAAGARHVRVALAAARGACEVELGEPPPGLRIVHLVAPEAAWLKAGLRDVVTEPVRAARLRVTLSAGMRTRLLVRSADVLFWPAAFDVEPGGSYRLRRDAPRPVQVALPPDAKLTAADFFPDLRWTPELPPERVDAWRERLNAPGWLRDELRRDGPLRVLPSVPFHFFGVVDRKPVYRHVALDGDRLELARPYRVRRVREPRVDGRPLPEGTVVAPGRLDLLTVATVSLPGCTWRVGAGAWPEDVRLPVADWLTVWHPDIGLAHLPWQAGQAPQGATFPGKAVVAVPPGLVARGHVSVYPVWRGTGRMQTVPPDAPLRRTFDGRKPVWFRGLPFGHYGMSVAVELGPEHGAERAKVSRVYEFDVTAAEPVGAFELPRR